jgi:hypothetical protein
MDDPAENQPTHVDQKVSMTRKDKPVEIAPAHPKTHLLMAVQLQQLCQIVQHRMSLIQVQVKQQQQANSNKMGVQAATTAPVLPIPTRKMAVLVADPALATVSTIPCVDCQPRHCGILSSPKRKSKREARFQGNYSAEERVGGHNRGRDDEEACPTAKV